MRIWLIQAARIVPCRDRRNARDLREALIAKAGGQDILRRGHSKASYHGWEDAGPPEDARDLRSGRNVR